MAKVCFKESDDLMDIRYDGVFKAVFTRNTYESNTALSRLISALIGREISVISINTNEPPIWDLRDRRIRFDINCKAENGEPVIIESPRRLIRGAFFFHEPHKNLRKLKIDIKIFFHFHGWTGGTV